MISENYELCWNTGHYSDQSCSLCPHQFECSGSELDDDDDDEE